MAKETNPQITRQKLMYAAQQVMKQHGPLDFIPLADWQAAAKAAKLPFMENTESPIALAMHSVMIELDDAANNRKPTITKHWRGRFFSAAHQMVCAAA
jgi:hypothetical protein